MDCLRILSMLMVLILHLIMPGGIQASLHRFSVEYYAVHYLLVLCFCAVDCFALLSGYMGCQAHFSYRKIWKLWTQVAFYTISLFLIAHLLQWNAKVTYTELLKAFFPITSRHYWYVSAYFWLCITMPLCNYLLLQCDKIYIKNFLWGFFLLWCIVSQIPLLSDSLEELHRGFCGTWIIYMYMLGGFIRRYGFRSLIPNCIVSRFFLMSQQSPSRRWYFIFYLCFATLAWFFATWTPYLSSKFLHHELRYYRMVNYISPAMVFMSVSLLAFFRNLSIYRRCQPWISFFASTSFAVYLIHCEDHVLELLTGAFSAIGKWPCYYSLPAIIFIAILIFVGCSCMDYSRQLIWSFFIHRK